MQFSAPEVQAFTKLYSTKTEAAAAIGVSRNTLNRMIERGADTTQTLAMMMVMMMPTEMPSEVDMATASIETIEQAFAGYQDAADHVEGFVFWAWDQRRMTIKAIEDGELEELIGDIAYTISAWARSLDEPRPLLVEAAAACYLSEHGEALIEALRDSLDF